MPSRTQILGAVVLIEGIIIVVLAANHYRVVLQPSFAPVTVTESPLHLALDYESSDAKFEQLVNEHSGWIAYRSPVSGMPILASCAIAMKTNYVRILIAHGADVQKTRESLQKIGAEEALNLLREVGSANKHADRPN
jgi:hypothetical protein